jgi:hypothetical protein
MKGVPSMILSQGKAPSSPARLSSHKKFGDEKHLREAQKTGCRSHSSTDQAPDAENVSKTRPEEKRHNPKPIPATNHNNQ